MRVVVAGGAGFLGSHLCDALLARGDEVLCVDNYITGSPANVAHLVGNPAFTLIDGDVCDPAVVAIDGPLDAVMNFASPASPKDYLEHPVATLAVGSVGTANLLDLARERGAVSFMASTSEIYGDPQVHPQPESYWGHVNSIGPRSCYDEAKRFAEALTMAYHRQHGVDVRIVRFFNTYGPRMRPGDGRVVSNFVVQALAGDPITIYGKGDQTRSFGYVDDTIRGVVALLDSDVTEPVNIGNPGEFTIAELAEVVLDLTGSSSEVVYEPLPTDDPTQRRPDISRARDRLGWEPTIALRDGLVPTIEYFRTVV